MRPRKKDLEQTPEHEAPSKSARKRASLSLQKLGEELADLKPAARAALPLPPLPKDLLEALAMHDRVKDHEGRRRQRQYIGKLMRGLDEEVVAEIKNALAKDSRKF